MHRYRNWLPHWRQPGKWYFVTFRLGDSLAQPKLRQWKEERELWLKFHPQPWPEKVEQEYHRRFTVRIEGWLDAGQGACVLRREAAHLAVASALHFFAAGATDGGCKPPALGVRAVDSLRSSERPVFSEQTSGFEAGGSARYELGDFVVMPNHVHALVRPLGEWELEQILHSWKTFTAKAINRHLGRRGPVWWKESFDHLVRGAEHFAKFQGYIADNPAKARLKPGEYHLHQTSLCYLNIAP